MFINTKPKRQPTFVQEQINVSAPQQNNASYLEKINNRIYFYSDIYTDKILQFNKSIREMNNDLSERAAQLGLESQIPIYIHINSNGGYVIDGFSAMDEIMKSRCPVYTIVDGIAASAATFLSVVGKKRFIKQNSFILIHQLSTASWGKYSEILDNAQNCKKLMEKIKKIYLDHTKLTEKDLNKLLEHDLYLDSEEALKYGFVDEII